VQVNLADEAAIVDLLATFSRSDAGPVQVLVVNHAIADSRTHVTVPVAECPSHAGIALTGRTSRLPFSYVELKVPEAGAPSEARQSFSLGPQVAGTEDSDSPNMR
jgi:hypothetical protein